MPHTIWYLKGKIFVCLGKSNFRILGNINLSTLLVNLPQRMLFIRFVAIKIAVLI